MRPRKRFGQHFLADPTVIRRIVAAIDPKPGDALIEIGPGHGVLTRALIAHCPGMRAIEIDRDLAAELAADPALATLRLDNRDVLDVNWRQLRNDGPKLRLVGNLPYNISTPLLFHVLEQHDAIADAHFMLQKEVVARMAASPGGKAYGRLTVMLAPHCRVESLFDVPPGAFRPPPKVTSSVARLVPHSEPPFPLANPQRFAQVVAAAFSQRRKTLRNALQAIASPTQMQTAGIDPSLRAERIEPARFAALADLLGPA